jgi:hypothetical protein
LLRFTGLEAYSGQCDRFSAAWQVGRRAEFREN